MEAPTHGPTGSEHNGDGDPGRIERIDIREAWSEVVAQVRVRNPRAATTVRYRDAAVANGLPEDAVETLADLYRKLEYSSESASDEDEWQAWQSLRRIQGGEPE